MPTPSAFAGRLSLVSLSDLLETMQANHTTGELRLKTDFGAATVWFDNGQLLDARIGSFQGEAAVFRLLGLTDGSFEVKSIPVSRSRVITQPVRALLRRRSQRSLEWKSLVEKLPPLGTVLVLDLQSFSAVSSNLTEEQLSIIQLVDGRRAIFEIIDDSGRDAVEVLRQVDELIGKGLISTEAEAGGGGVGYGEGRNDESGILPPSSRGPETASGNPKSEPYAAESRSPATEVANDRTPPPVLTPPPLARPSAATKGDAAKSEPAPLSSLVDSIGARPGSNPLTQVRGGPKLGRYEVLSRLGRGGMGTVYLARITGDGGFRRLFAVKVLRSHLSRSDEATQMLMKEARIASRVDHPNIVSVVDVGSHEGQPYLVMDYVTGCSLADLLKAHSSRASTAAAVSIILDTLAGLHAAHTLADDDGVGLDVIHHDVSPHNIMVGLDGIARLSDFGVAYVRRTIGEAEETSRGKPAYTAPERVKGGAGDRRSDVFSVGVILWNALTGAPLFEGPDIDTTLENVLTRPIPPASRHGRSPESLDAVCFKALQRSPDKRYQSAEEMLVHLRKVAASEDLLGSPSEVKQWVREAMGHELDVQRLSFLDAARMAREAEASSNLLPVRPHREDGPGSEASRTIELGRTDQRTTIAKWVAVGFGLFIILVAALLPDKIRGLGKRGAASKEPPSALQPRPEDSPARSTEQTRAPLEPAAEPGSVPKPPRAAVSQPVSPPVSPPPSIAKPPSNTAQPQQPTAVSAPAVSAPAVSAPNVTPRAQGAALPPSAKSGAGGAPPLSTPPQRAVPSQATPAAHQATGGTAGTSSP